MALGCAESTAERLQAAPGDAQRELRAFDEELLIERPRPLALGSVQALPVPGRCELGDCELELHPADGHTPDGMAVLIPWAGVLVAGDYLSAVEMPTLERWGAASTRTWRRSSACARCSRARSTSCPATVRCWTARARSRVLDEDVAYLRRARRAEAPRPSCPNGRRGAAQRRLHAENVRAIASSTRLS